MSGREKSDARTHKDIGMALPYFDTEERKQRKTLFQTVIESRNRKESMDEEARILYVALTRAKDRLLLVGTVPDAEKALENYMYSDAGSRKMTSCYLDMIAPTFLQKKLNCNVHSRSDVFLQAVKSENFKDELKETLAGTRTLPRNAEIEKFVNSRLSFEYPYKKALSAKSKYSVSGITRAEQPAGVEKTAAVPIFMQGVRKPTGAEIGAAVHVVMDKLDFKRASEKFALGDGDGRRYLSELIRELREKIIIAEETAGMINPLRIEMFIKSDIGKRAARAEKLYKEAPFNIVKEIDGIETIIQGVIDCYFEENGEYVLIDYKTDYIPKGEGIEKIKEMYGGQVSLYAEALEIIRDVKVKEKYLYLFGRDEAVPV
jgi:ATP-dependent helicase/nuclease subunit A